MSASVVHTPAQRHKCRIGWKAVPLPEDHLARSTGAVMMIVADGQYDPPGTIRECEVCGKTWVGYREGLVVRHGRGYHSVTTKWRPEGRFERWWRKRKARPAAPSSPSTPEETSVNRSRTCKICHDTGCTVAVPKQDLAIVRDALRDQYGRSLERIASLTEFASHIVHDVAKAGRLGPGFAPADDWAPSAADIDDFNPQGVSGMMRLWRAEEIGYYALIALAKAGRLLPRDET